MLIRVRATMTMHTNRHARSVHETPSLSAASSSVCSLSGGFSQRQARHKAINNPPSSELKTMLYIMRNSSLADNSSAISHRNMSMPGTAANTVTLRLIATAFSG